MDYKLTELQSLCDVTSSKRIYAKELCSAGVPFYRSKEIIEKLQGAKEHSNPLYISEERYQEIIQNAGSLTEGDLLLTSRGTLGVPYIVAANDRFHFADGNLTWFRNFNGLDSRYLKYFFLSPVGKGELGRCVIGSSQAAYTIASLKKISIPLPELEHQLKAVGVLSTYDKLIENNRRRISILEDMAQSLYREWFVKFRFPGHENCQLKDSSLGQVPKDWDVKKIKDFGEVITGKTPSKKKTEYYDSCDVPFIKTPDMHEGMFITDTSEKLSFEGADSQKKKLLPVGSISVSCIGTAGIVAINSEPSQTNQQINSVVLYQDSYREFLYFSLLDLKQIIINHGSTGATMTNLSKGKFEALEVVCPSDEIISIFSNLIRSNFDAILCLHKKNSNLRIQRDLLLPKLISGSIEI